jgi:glycosyltransferase involved in cell wall biosynthesis
MEDAGAAAVPGAPREVLHVLGTAERAGAGIADMVRVLAERLDPSEYRVSACFLGTPGPWTTSLRRAGVDTWHLPWRPPWDLKGAARVWRFLRGRPTDLVHCHFGGRSVRGLLRWGTGAPLVVHAHGRVRHEGDFEPVPLVLRDANLVIATSRAVADFVVAPEVRVVYPSVTMPDPTAPPVSTERVVGAAGRLVPIKGFDRLIQAFARVHAAHPDVRLEIAGEGPSSNALQAEVSRLGLSGAVEFLGWVDRLPEAMRGWTVFAQPSMEEAFGITVLQAMACGLPVVASDVGGLPELVDPGTTGLMVPPGDVGALAEALQTLLRDAPRREAAGSAGKERARAFGEDRFATEVASIYRALLTPAHHS